ncbi:MAG: LLM class flavin-dependent oxidoreductase, partial [Nitrososphaerota archaeon]|nr:LLM class flavin-dependent oxidoreductase [Nitrososphaerota archaeon]
GAISSLYEISDGRADLGLTGGGIPNLHGRLGVEWTDLPNKSREAVILIKRLLKGERVVHKGKYYSIDDLQLQAPQRNVRVLLAAHAPRMINVAAEVADGMIMIKGPLEFQKFLLGTYEKTLKELKRPRWSGHTVMESVVIVDNDRKTAYDRARPFAAEMVSHYNLVYKPPRESLAMKALGLTREQGEYYQQNPQELPDEIIPKVTICGSVEDCISQIKELKQLGLDEFYCWYPEYGIEQLITTDLIKSREQLIRDVGGMLLPEVQKI